MSKIEWNEKTFAKFSYLSDVRISKDGKQIAYVLTKANLKDNKYENTIVIEDLESGVRKFVEDASIPRFSPSGTKMSFVRPNEEKKISELWLVDLRSMSAKKLMEVKNILNVSWSDDDRRLLITGFKRREDEDFIFEDDVPVWFDSKGFFDGEKTTFWIYDTEGEEILDEFTTDKFSSAIWHGDEIIYNVPHRENNKPQFFKFYDIYRYKDGERETIFEKVSFAAIDSNGKEVLLIGKPRKEKISEHDYLYLWDGKEVKPLTERFIYNNWDGKLDAEGNLYFLSPREGRVSLYKLSDDELTPIVDENAWVMQFDVSNDGKVVLLKQTDTKLSEVFLWDGELKQITDYNGPILSKLKTRPIRHFRFKSLDLELDGWYIKPDIKEGEKAPVIVFVHGGPKGMYGYYFKYEMQLMADKGYYIVFVNPRGSNGYDEDFALRVLERTGLEDFQDIMNGIEEFFKLELQADKERVGITGISYGGFMTNWALTQSDLFKAGISENGISYWLTSYAFSDIGLWFDKEVIGDNPLENENYKKLSPLFYAQNVKAPILIIHSLEDYRCPLDQSVMFYHVLKDLGKEAYIAIFKRGAHGHSIRGSPRHRAKRYKLFMEFFERKLKKYEEGFDVEKILKEEKGEN
ncbi:alpha/beta hydrolase family protein [Thermococcus paralvinellae]|uniref:Dipeptidyl aminopeptidases/acylaminoacyl-peptidase n=1 Tax=Thermococcus paralvinellae TaxID=582419 RepID=W0I9K2_9EURY|nr:S9 family peptidase [Thermococcus paralvinellae]AHF81145.1 Dipeptidyl aminopeptidases/acylaminoacyl-peptidase [Thermococcus paralvinellae]